MGSGAVAHPPARSAMPGASTVMAPVPTAGISASAGLCVLAGGETLLLRLAVVREVLRPPVLTRMPHAPAALLGLCNLRGAVLPVVSLGVVCGGGERDQAADIDGHETGSAARVVVVEAGPGRVGLLVDAVLPSDTGTGRRIEPETLLPPWFEQAARPATRHAGIAADLRTATRNTAARTALLGFRVGGREFALALEAVVSVSALPTVDAIASEAGARDLLDAEAATLGVATLRGKRLPVLDAAALLGLDRDVGGGARMVVTRIGNRAAGLAVDAVTGILRLPAAAIGPVPPLLLRGLPGEARIEGICHMEDGRRLVQLLHPDRLLHARTLQRLASLGTETNRDAAAMAAGGAVDASGERFLLIQLGAERFGVPLAAVDEVMRHPGSLTRLPNAPAFIAGMTTLRGRVLPVIHGRQWFGVQAAAADANRRIVVLRSGTLRVGLAVDQAADMARFAFGAIRPAAGSGPVDRVLDRLATQEAGDTVRLVDPAALLEAVGRDMLAAAMPAPPRARTRTHAGAPS